MMLKKIPSAAKLLLPGMLYFLLFVSAFSPLPLDEFHYLIETESNLIVAGSSNVNEFNCDCSCERDFTRNSLNMIRQSDSERISFSNARLKLTTTNLDCGHKVMNKDLYHTLRADEFPYIYITLLQAEPLPSEKQLVSFNQQQRINALTRITLAGRDKRVRIPVTGAKIDDGRFQFTGEVTLKMTDFGLEPPTAMLGLIKVNNEITIHLDLVVRVLENG